MGRGIFNNINTKYNIERYGNWYINKRCIYENEIVMKKWC